VFAEIRESEARCRLARGYLRSNDEKITATMCSPLALTLYATRAPATPRALASSSIAFMSARVPRFPFDDAEPFVSVLDTEP
jgi:hypothetical protein